MGGTRAWHCQRGLTCNAAHVLPDADSSRRATSNEAVSACGFLFFCFGSVWDGVQNLAWGYSTGLGLVGFAPVKCTSRGPPPCTGKCAKEYLKIVTLIRSKKFILQLLPAETQRPWIASRTPGTECLQASARQAPTAASGIHLEFTLEVDLKGQRAKWMVIFFRTVTAQYQPCSSSGRS